MRLESLARCLETDDRLNQVVEARVVEQASHERDRSYRCARRTIS
jgi:hypothetical protein